MTTKTTKAAKAPRVGITVDANENVTALNTDGVAINADAFRIDMNDPGFRFERVEADDLKAQ